MSTVVGQDYTFDFWLANVGGNPNDFTAKIGGVTELSLVNAGGQSYTEYTYDFVATSTTTPVEFDFRHDPSEWRLDDVSLVAAGSPPPPPPPPPNSVTVTGTSGNDVLSNPPGTVSDTLIGNGGNDTFAFHGSSFGNDIITDFIARPRQQHDTIQLDHAVLADFSAVQSHSSQVGANTVITIDATNSITLLGVSVTNLRSYDFHLV